MNSVITHLLPTSHYALLPYKPSFVGAAVQAF